VTRSDSFEIVEYRSEFKGGVIDLWRRVFHDDAGEKRRYFEWKYEQNPYLREPTVFVALDRTGRVIGTRGFHGSRWETPGGDVLIPSAEDFAIDVDHRSTGLATAIMRVALDEVSRRGYEYTMNASGGQTTVLQSLAMGWRSVGSMEPVARIARTGRARLVIIRASRRARRYLGPPQRLSRAFQRSVLHGRSFEQLDRLAGHSVPGRQTSIVVESSPNPVDLARLVAELPRDGRIKHVRDPAFFEWRYANPSREYRFLLARRSGRLEGFMAIGRSHPVPFQIVDWEGTSPAVREELLESALSLGGFSVLSTWTSSLSDSSKELLQRSGFELTETGLRSRGMPCVLLKKLRADGDWYVAGVSALDPSNWDIRLIDSMLG
jgi:GNAT superfamily N-acetyltransferase